ncbi:ATP-dependent DNA helicase RecG [Salicibibacter halophilus]|uniref:ATP-dependent DNA helicase RecG n=1 Tax=Salicibibacter halophilus TaxID=2502791 RepID=A0A514LFC2_9BACI|nr:ATP-dependent DNA helicase RecG [Salicibibacter halophilus]QDI90557.1 ATP-dependent DNA helicase RecG [Salicibibacter halophilus]
MTSSKKPQTSIEELKGVGPETMKDLDRLGIFTWEDLLWHLPHRYENVAIRPVEELEHDAQATLAGTVQGPPTVKYYGAKKNRLSFRLFADEHLIQVVAFNRAFLKNKLQPETKVNVTGKWDRYRAQLTAQRIEFGDVDETRAYAPVYTITGKLTVRQLENWIKQVIRQDVFPEEALPVFLQKKYKLPTIAEALATLHQPENAQTLKNARRRVVYEEFLCFQLNIQAYKRTRRKNERAEPTKIDEASTRRFVQALPFALTDAQARSLREILADIQDGHKMNRLLQGDVGSGKTVVAACAMYAVVGAGKQAALMVPTEILASQHAESLAEFFHPYGLEVALLTGSTKTARRKEIHAGLESGEISMIVGTHALIQAAVPFHDLGLVITDEQHRFGVEQRRALREKGNPDALFMTATPIPRTLAITAYGEMDVSRIDEQPSGRKPVKTYWAKPDMLERIIAFVHKETSAGKQAYVICPLIEESEQLDVQNAIDIHAQLETLMPDNRIGLLHGRLREEEKEAAMDGFTGGDIDVLVATTVVEVGVNVANATIMIIYDADRFGLSQLHQLRGRVGRGDAQSYCILLSDPASETGKERMRIMTETTDGFVLAEKDLRLRGPGDLLGQKQSGMPEFRLADPVHDYRALDTARQDASALLDSEEFWQHPDYQTLRDDVQKTGAISGKKLD